MVLRECPKCGGEGTIETETFSDLLDKGRQIREEVAARYEMNVTEMISSSHEQVYVAARREAAQRMRTETNLTMSAIGFILGRRDHSTISTLLRTASTAPATKSRGVR